jgi:hypothetical protein
MNADSRLSRFLTQSNHYKGEKATYKAFLPPPDLEFSVFHTDGLEPPEVREVARQHLLPTLQAGRSVYGHADLEVAIYEGQHLTATRDDNPERHTAVTGWPAGTADDKEAHKEIALELADAASLRVFPVTLIRSGGQVNYAV